MIFLLGVLASEVKIGTVIQLSPPNNEFLNVNLLSAASDDAYGAFMAISPHLI